MSARASGEPVVREALDDERPMLAARVREWWGSETIVSRGRAIDAAAVGGLVADDASHRSPRSAWTGSRCTTRSC